MDTAYVLWTVHPIIRNPKMTGANHSYRYALNLV